MITKIVVFGLDETQFLDVRETKQRLHCRKLHFLNIMFGIQATTVYSGVLKSRHVRISNG